MKMMKISVLAMAIAAVMAGGSFASTAAPVREQQVIPLASQQVTPANSAYFTGTAWVRSFFTPTPDSRTYGANVTFAPGARTYWHIHPSQQILIVTEGEGYVQEWGKPVQHVRAGDVVICPPGVKHWHGAAAHSTMTHMAVSEKSDGAVQWLEEVKGEF